MKRHRVLTFEEAKQLAKSEEVEFNSDKEGMENLNKTQNVINQRYNNNKNFRRNSENNFFLNNNYSNRPNYNQPDTSSM